MENNLMQNNFSDNEPKKREAFSSKFGFMMAAIGSAVGLGNLWAFPYKLGKGGGFPFLLMYIVFVLLFGCTVTLGEYVIGRTTKRSPIAAMASFSKKYAFIGWMQVLASLGIMSFYTVIGGWVLKYLCMFVFSIFGENSFTLIGGGDYFIDFISSPLEPIVWTFLFMLINFVIVKSGIEKGIERACKIMMPALFVMIIIVAVKSLSLPGAFEGVKFMFAPNFEVFKNGGFFGIATLALGQMFFSCSIGTGAGITYGSYLKDDVDIAKSAIIVPIADMVVAIFAGLAIMPAVFAFGYEPSAGPGLLFIIIKDIFTSMPFGNLFGTMFFVVALFGALSSSIAMLDISASYFIDSKHMPRKKAITIMTVITCAMAVPVSLSQGILSYIRPLTALGYNFDLLDTMDFFSEYILLTLGCCFLSIFVGWIWKPFNAKEAIESTGHRFGWFKLWAFSIKWLCPPVCFLLFLSTIGIIG